MENKKTPICICLFIMKKMYLVNVCATVLDIPKWPTPISNFLP